MLTYNDILHSVTKLLSIKFNDVNVIIDNEEGIGDTCFYVQLVPLETTVDSNTSNLKGVIVSVKYFSNKKNKCYEIASQLNGYFSRTLKVKDRVLNISNTEANFYEDEVGHVLDFLITLKYIESIEIEKETNDLMQSVDVKTEIRK